jgi:ParB/RepB/Spo0J family partition protein
MGKHAEGEGMTEKILLEKIQPAPFQPRKEFNPVKLQELADSMREQGLIEPIIVRPHNGGFQLIAGERRFRAAKLLGWKDIRAEVCPMDDLEAEEKSVVENVHRGDLTGNELADIVYDLWQKGGPSDKTGGNGRYLSQEALSKALGWKERYASALIAAKKDADRLGLGSQSVLRNKLFPGDLDETRGLENDSERLALLKKKADGEIGSHELRDYSKAMMESPTKVKEAILDKPKTFTPKVAEGLSKLPEESQAGTIAAIKKGRMDEEKAVQLTKTVKESTGQVKEAVLENPDRFTPKVAEGISKLSTPEAQKSTIDAIKKHRLEEGEAIELTKMMDGQMAYAKEHKVELEEKAREFAALLKQWEKERSKDQSTPGRIRVGHAFRNIMAHMGIVHEIESSSGSCTCPHCGKEASEYLRWTCCDEGKNETLAQAFEDAKRQHEAIVKEETKKTVRWK